MNKFREIPIKSIQVGQRFRKDCGSLQLLATSISKIGLLHPIIVRQEDDEKYTLLAGFRRLQAHNILNFDTICAHVLIGGD